MNVVLTGASGFVGHSVAQALHQRGHHTRILLRPAAQSAARARILTPSPSGSETHQIVNFSSPADLRDAVRGTDALIHLVGIIREFKSDTFQSVHTDLTRRLVQACRDTGVHRWIHMSALGTRPAARSRYHQTKWEGEQIVRTSGLNWTIFRPSLIYGARDEFTRFFARMSRALPFLPVIGGGRSLMQPVAVENVARAFASAVDRTDVHDRIFDLCGHERLEFRAILKLILESTGRRRLLLPIPWGIAKIQASVMQRVWPVLLGKPSPLNRDQIVMLEEDNIGDPTPADVAFELKHIPLREALAAQFR